MKLLIVITLLIASLSGMGQVSSVEKRIRSLEVDAKLDRQERDGMDELLIDECNCLKKRVDSLSVILDLWRDKIDRMYERQGDNEIRFWRLSDKVQDLGRHGIGVYPQWQKRDTLALGPFYIY